MKNGCRGFTLAELIMAIAMLAFFSVFIVQMFAKADQLTDKAADLDRAVACASDLADQWKRQSADDLPSELLDLRRNLSAGRTATLGLDRTFQPSDRQNAVYSAVLVLEEGQPEGLWHLNITICSMPAADSGPIYTLRASRYFPQEDAQP